MKYNIIEYMRLTPNFNWVKKGKAFLPPKITFALANVILGGEYNHFVILTLMNQPLNLILLYQS